MARYHFTAVYYEAAEGGVIARIEELPEVHCEGATIEEARACLDDAIELVLTSNRAITHRTFRNARVLHRERMSAGPEKWDGS